MNPLISTLVKFILDLVTKALLTLFIFKAGKTSKEKEVLEETLEVQSEIMAVSVTDADVVDRLRKHEF